MDERLFIFNRHCLVPLVANAAGKFLKAGRTMGLAGKHALSIAGAALFLAEP
ncbi:hypothetical protein B4098_0428 [Heyndrickxia coagulans]|jgi:hypothetical protein|uniref:Uncharacterized protein n=1 Tax=Heyndrickxia coagulans TaxID=1398 RepID=A0A150K0M8_HEYCO|nr:hypothetical protein BCO26_0764 [Heyndrickxia coagulans 2-6]KYC63022.1 hypothetical protein B4098_0428 [Heyndrickxia coagulans]